MAAISVGRRIVVILRSDWLTVNFRLLRDVTEELHLRKKRITINALCDLSTTSVFFFLNAHSLSH